MNVSVRCPLNSASPESEIRNGVIGSSLLVRLMAPTLAPTPVGTKLAEKLAWSPGERASGSCKLLWSWNCGVESTPEAMLRPSMSTCVSQPFSAMKLVEAEVQIRSCAALNATAPKSWWEGSTRRQAA